MSDSTHSVPAAHSSGSTPSNSAFPSLNSTHAPDTAETLLESGQSYERSGERHSARNAYARALVLLQGADAQLRKVAVLRWIARTHQLDADYEKALESIAMAEHLATEIEDRTGLGHCLIVRANISWQRGDLDGAVSLHSAALDVAREVGDAHLAAVASQNLGVVASARVRSIRRSITFAPASTPIGRWDIPATPRSRRTISGGCTSITATGRLPKRNSPRHWSWHVRSATPTPPR